mmetsp:Transcript_24259/g.43908  ORF Transcript_24259/g.43908 Transcript_24259/m.43908 type:complete len:216 (-) Transcript_24259:183-830(-)
MRDPVIMKSRFRTRKVQARVATVEALVVKRLHALWHLLLGDLLAIRYLLHFAQMGCLTFLEGRNAIRCVLAGHLANGRRQVLDVPRLLGLTVFDNVNIDGHEIKALAGGWNTQECFLRQARASGNKDVLVTGMKHFFNGPLDVGHGCDEAFDEIRDALVARTDGARCDDIGVADVVRVVAFRGLREVVRRLATEAFRIHVLEASRHGVSSKICIS